MGRKIVRRRGEGKGAIAFWQQASGAKLHTLWGAETLELLLEARNFILHRQHFGQLGQSLAAASRVAATVAGTPADRLAAKTPKLEQPRRREQVGFRFASVCLGHLQFALSLVIARHSGPASPARAQA